MSITLHSYHQIDLLDYIDLPELPIEVILEFTREEKEFDFEDCYDSLERDLPNFLREFEKAVRKAFEKAMKYEFESMINAGINSFMEPIE